MLILRLQRTSPFMNGDVFVVRWQKSDNAILLALFLVGFSTFSQAGILFSSMNIMRFACFFVKCAKA